MTVLHRVDAVVVAAVGAPFGSVSVRVSMRVIELFGQSKVWVVVSFNPTNLLSNSIVTEASFASSFLENIN